MNPLGYGEDGLVATIPLGKGGLFTDSSQVDIPINNLIRANNVFLWNGILEKDPGSRRWNSSAMPAGVINALEYFPDFQTQNQRVVTVLSDGTVYKFNNYYTQAIVSASGSAPTNLKTANYTKILLGGNEQAGNNKKVFIFTGYDPVQVISGDGTTRTNMSSPASDWTGTNQPLGGILYRGRLFAWGCQNNPHQVYASLATDHENFTSQPLNFNVYPGEGDFVVGGGVFRGRLYIVKYPLGLYYLVDTDNSSTNWYFAKFGADDFGGVSPHALLSAKDDLFIGNNYGSITSLKASLIYGDLMTSDLFSQLSIFRDYDQEIRPDIFNKRFMVWYGKRKLLLTTYQSYMSTSNDRIFVLDMSKDNVPPKPYWITKDQPNCLFMLRNAIKVAKPYYGANDGYIYEMDVADRWVGTSDTTVQTAYTFEAQTPHFDLGQGENQHVKTFDFLELVYEPTGDFSVSVDVYLDAKFSGTYTFNLSGRSNLNESLNLGTSVVDGLCCFTSRQQIYGEGRTISLRFTNSVAGQNVRLAQARIWYRPSTQQERVG